MIAVVLEASLSGLTTWKYIGFLSGKLLSPFISSDAWMTSSPNMVTVYQCTHQVTLELFIWFLFVYLVS